MKYQPEQITRYLEMAVHDIERIAIETSHGAASKSQVRAALQTLDLAGWVLVADSKRMDVNQAKQMINPAEAESFIQNSLSMPELASIVQDSSRRIDGFRDGPSWVYLDGADQVDSTVAKKYVSLIKKAIMKIKKILEGRGV